MIKQNMGQTETSMVHNGTALFHCGPCLTSNKKDIYMQTKNILKHLNAYLHDLIMVLPFAPKIFKKY